MTRYRLNLVNVGSISIEVEAESEDEAIDLAYERVPQENIHTGFDLGEWVFASDLWPGSDRANEIEILD